MTLPEGIVVRSLEPRDVEAVVAIEGEAFTTPWQANTFHDLIGRDAVELLVMVDADGRVIGYAVLWCIVDQGELANLAISVDHRGSGLGTHLLGHVLDVARARRVSKLFLEVRRSNEPALDLYRRAGFAEVGVRRGYYTEPKEDAIVMLLTL